MNDDAKQYIPPTFTKLDASTETKSGPHFDANEDPFNNFYGPITS